MTFVYDLEIWELIDSFDTILPHGWYSTDSKHYKIDDVSTELHKQIYTELRDKPNVIYMSEYYLCFTLPGVLIAIGDNSLVGVGGIDLLGANINSRRVVQRPHDVGPAVNKRLREIHAHITTCMTICNAVTPVD